MRVAAELRGWVARRLSPKERAILFSLWAAAACLGVGAAYSQRGSEHPTSTASAAERRGLVPVSDAVADAPRRRGEAAHYRRIAGKYVRPSGARAYLPLYREAERRYAVSWRLIASIHRQETAFSTSSSTYHGLNDFGCCAGPMQFNVTNGPVSTWKRHSNAFRDGRRPAWYPHRTRSHPSIYDDFDAIMAAGLLLSRSGAGTSLDAAAWSAAYSYYGHDLFGITYASQVIARALAWQRDGFCPNCPLDEGLVADVENAYGTAARIELVGDEQQQKLREKHRKRKKHRKPRDKQSERHKRKGGDHRGRHRPPARLRRPWRPKRTKPSPPRARRRETKPAPPAPTPQAPPPTAATPTTTAPAPAPPNCRLLERLVGCK